MLVTPSMFPLPFARAALVLALAGASCSAVQEPGPVSAPSPEVPPSDLRPPEAFAAIADPAQRSQALFLEASRVLLDARCTNCHPSDDSPRQRGGELHDPPVVRGDTDHGRPGPGVYVLPPGPEPGAGARAGRAGVAPGAAIDGVGGALAGGALRADQGSRAQRRQDAARRSWSTRRTIRWSPGAGPRARIAGRCRGRRRASARSIAAWVETGAACPREEALR